MESLCKTCVNMLDFPKCWLGINEDLGVQLITYCPRYKRQDMSNCEEFKFNKVSKIRENGEIKPCPFCGSLKIKTSGSGYGYSNYSYRIKCLECGGMMEVEDDIYDKDEQIVIDECIKRWNNRSK